MNCKALSLSPTCLTRMIPQIRAKCRKMCSPLFEDGDDLLFIISLVMMMMQPTSSGRCYESF